MAMNQPKLGKSETIPPPQTQAPSTPPDTWLSAPLMLPPPDPNLTASIQGIVEASITVEQSIATRMTAFQLPTPKPAQYPWHGSRWKTRS